MKRALFLDFEDSFSFNVVQELTLSGLEVTVIQWRDLPEAPETDLLVLGPGPGHPREYEAIEERLMSWLDRGGRILGICLGHQLLWRLRGREVTRSQHPLHGQKVELRLSPQWTAYFRLKAPVLVQRYNSLAVLGESEDSFSQDGEILITCTKQVISYQFHPESVGTNCRRAFFDVAITNLL